MRNGQKQNSSRDKYRLGDMKKKSKYSNRSWKLKMSHRVEGPSEPLTKQKSAGL